MQFDYNFVSLFARDNRNCGASLKQKQKILHCGLLIQLCVAEKLHHVDMIEERVRQRVHQASSIVSR